MIDCSTKCMIQVGKQRLGHYRVICDKCGHERWITPRAIKNIKTEGHLCRPCNSSQMVKERSQYKDLPGAQYIEPRWYLPVICPDCKESRLVRAVRAASASLCKYCRDVCMGKNTKVGVRDSNGKTCPHCKQYRLYSEYYKSSRDSDGMQCYCNSCAREMGRIYGRVQVARKRGNGGSFTASEWLDLCEQFDNRCLACSEHKPLHADHILPVSKGGSSNIENIQPLCARCNGKKSNKTVDYRIGALL